MKNQSPSAPSDAHNQVVCTRFAQFLKERKVELCEAWMTEVQRDDEVPTGETIPKPLLIDHVPKLLDGLIDLLAVVETKPISPETKGDAQEHGTQRYRLGYKLDEVIRELADLRAVLIRCSGEFGQEDSQFVGGAQTSAACRLHRFVDESARWSTVRFAEEQKELLQKSSESLTNVSRGVCYELANGLNAIGLAAHLLVTEEPVRVEEIEHSIQDSVDSMRTLLSGLRELSTLSAGGMRLHPAPFAPSELTREIACAYETAARAKGLRVSFTSDPALSTLVSDERRLRQVALRLVSNAVNYTDAGQVQFHLREVDADRWAIVVTDTGAGIALEFQQKVFDEFFRVSKTSGVEGVGLGLAIVIRLVRLLNGEAILESETGKGTRFEVILPKVFSPANLVGPPAS